MINRQIEDIYFTVGKNIERLRGRMSQEKLSKKAGVARGTVGSIEKGEAISLESLIKIAHALGVEPEDLFISNKDRQEITYKHKLLLDLISKSLGLESK